MKLRALAAVVSVRFERFAPGEIAVGTRPVNPSDSMYVQDSWTP